MTTTNKIRVVFVSSFTPRECGIATFSRDLVDAIDKEKTLKPSVVIAVNERGAHYNYSPRIKFQIKQERHESYTQAARYINKSNIDLVNLQHEFGIFGGPWGRHLLTFLENLTKPVITTLHSVIPQPSLEPKRILQKIIEHSVHTIVMAQRGIDLLGENYNIPKDKVGIIPHGHPDFPFLEDTAKVKASLGLKGRFVLSTFGLINPGKGIEYAIRALPPLVKINPHLLYLIVGETHPLLRLNEGEQYRRSLFELTENLGLDDHVTFYNRFLEKRQLIRYIQATDIALIPYLNKGQITSGTLSYFLGAGKAIVSTPIFHAEEALKDRRGLLCKVRSSNSIRYNVQKLMTDTELRTCIRKKAYDYSRRSTWANVAKAYINLFQSVTVAN
jgi:glycosyltransferase involved in cell wall biosynthesis